MKVYKKVFLGSTEGLVRYARLRLISTRARIPVGVRFSSNIDKHINMRAGLVEDFKYCDAYGIIKTKYGYIRMY